MVRRINVVILLFSLFLASVVAFTPFSRTIIAHRSVNIAAPTESSVSARNLNILREGYKTFDEFLASVEVVSHNSFLPSLCLFIIRIAGAS